MLGGISDNFVVESWAVGVCHVVDSAQFRVACITYSGAFWFGNHTPDRYDHNQCFQPQISLFVGGRFFSYHGWVTN